MIWSEALRSSVRLGVTCLLFLSIVCPSMGQDNPEELDQDAIAESVSPVPQEVLDIMEGFPLWQDFIPLFEDLFAAVQSLDGAVSSLLQSIEVLTDLVSSVESLFNDAVNLVGDFAGGVIDDAGNWIEDTAGDIIDDIGDGVGDVIDGIGGIFGVMLSGNGEAFAFEPAYANPGDLNVNHDNGPAVALEGGSPSTNGGLSPMAFSSSDGTSSPGANANASDASAIQVLDYSAYPNVLESPAQEDVIVVHPVFTGNITGLSAQTLGLENVGNTADVDKPISWLAAEALQGVPARSEVPASADASCTPGDWAFDAEYVFVCLAPNTWGRQAFDASW